MKRLIYSLFLVPLLVSTPASAGDDMVVVELFTSQGCMACPPADKILAKLAMEKDVLALSWPVDYWDYLGWKDTFATAANTERQADYNQSMGKNGVFTPQVVINGRTQAVGSRENEVRALIEKLKADGTLNLEVELSGDRQNLVIGVDAGLTEIAATLWLVMYDTEQMVDIRYGDNRGRSLSYAHIVRGAQSLGQWTGDEMRVPIDMDFLAEVGADCIAVLVQEGVAGPILGAAKLRLADLD